MKDSITPITTYFLNAAKSIILSLFSSLLLVFSIPKYEMDVLAWIGIVPLLFAVYKLRPSAAFLVAYTSGMALNAGLYDWIFAAPGYQHYHHMILALILGLYLGFFGLLFNLICRKGGLLKALVSAPFLWVILEYIKSNLSFLALPFPLLAHSQYEHLALIQFSSFTGAYGLSFLIVLFNVVIAGFLMHFFAIVNGTAEKNNIPSRKGLFYIAAVVLIWFAGALVYGNNSISRASADEKLRVSVVQGNIEQEIKLDPAKHAGSIMKKYTDLTMQAAEDTPRLIVWPEAATPGLILKDMGLFNQMRYLVEKINTHFLVGSSEHAKFAGGSADKSQTGNTALFFSPQGKVLGQYLKIRLIPFGEYIPYADVIPWPRFIVPEGKGSYDVPGKEYTIFEIEGKQFGVVICSEGAFPNLFRKFVQKGAVFMLNITNEGWFGESALHQKVAASVFRSVENRRSLVRATNTGISCFIDPYGRLLKKVNKNGKEVSVEGYLTHDISIHREQTFYTRHGNIFVFLSFIGLGLVIGLPAFNKNKYRSG